VFDPQKLHLILFFAFAVYIQLYTLVFAIGYYTDWLFPFSFSLPCLWSLGSICSCRGNLLLSISVGVK
jgi:hypothetical protein